MDRPPPAANGAGARRPVQKKKPSGAASLFKPTNNQKNRYPLGANAKPLQAPQSRQLNGTIRPNLNSVTTFSKNDSSHATVPTITAGPVKEYKVVTTKRELLDGLRYHLMQLSDDIPLDIRKESDFSKPARLHRRNPDWKQHSKVPTDDPNAPKDAETEALDKRREARAKQREENLAQIAPSANSSRQKLFTKKTAQAYHNDFTPEEKRRMQMNYEERIPWVLEDFDNNHTLVGHHKQGSMGVYAAFVREQTADGERFRFIPVEKFYRFERHRTVQENTTWEDLEQQLKQNRKLADLIPESIQRKMEDRELTALREKEFRKTRGLYMEGQGLLNTREGEDADLDFEDDFADDEEGDIFGDKDEDEKAAEKKVREDHLKANIGWAEKDEREIETLEKREDHAEKMKERWASGMRKTLEKRERNFNLASDSDSDDSTDSEEERERLEAEKLANLKKDEEAGKSALSSGANTPSGRKEKHPASDRENGIKKSSSSRTLKRPGSPNLSDASGTDASTVRKKKKKSHHSSSQQPTPSGSRPRSPDNSRRGAGSDTDGGAMSDGTKRKIKIKRPGSPSANNSLPNSRPGSPGPGRPRNLNLDIDPFPSVEEVESRIPLLGMPTKEFLALYKMPSDGKRKADWNNYIKKFLKIDAGKVHLKKNLKAATPVPAPAASP